MNLRRLFACFLLLLLASQPTAAMTVCPHAQSGAAMAAMSQDAEPEQPCMHGEQAAARADVAAAGDTPAQSCCVSVACGMSSAVPHLPGAPAAISRHEPLNVAFDTSFISFVPEGLQRPPSSRA